MIPKYVILKHNITGEYHIASITEWGSKYILNDYFPVTSTDSLESAKISMEKLIGLDKFSKKLEHTKSANKIIRFFKENSLTSLDIPVYANGANIKDIQLDVDDDNNYFFNLIFE
jgi:hypothetical protein